MKPISLPEDLEILRQRVRRVIAPIEPAPPPGGREFEYLTKAERTEAGRALPDYYLVYFLFVELLQFPHLGQWEKVAWVVPIAFKGKIFTIEHRKFGLGLFVPDAKNEEDAARRIVALIRRAVGVAEPFFEWLASSAVRESKLNVVNRSEWLFDRYQYLHDRFREQQAEAERRKDERVVTKGTGDRYAMTTVEFPAYTLRQNAKWIGLAAIDAFFSWTEHIFIHLGILQGRARTGEQVAELADADWAVKFKAALDLTEPGTKPLFDKLVLVRRQLRNFMAHGAFGKRGEAFQFHSGAGAVPVLLTHRPGKGRYSLTGEQAFDEERALEVIEQFIAHLWSGSRAPARIYFEYTNVPTILTLANDGTYAQAMTSPEAMQKFAEGITQAFDNAANMDW